MELATLAYLGLLALLSMPGLAAPTGPLPATRRDAPLCDDPNVSWDEKIQANCPICLKMDELPGNLIMKYCIPVNPAIAYHEVNGVYRRDIEGVVPWFDEAPSNVVESYTGKKPSGGIPTIHAPASRSWRRDDDGIPLETDGTPFEDYGKSLEDVPLDTEHIPNLDYDTHDSAYFSYWPEGKAKMPIPGNRISKPSYTLHARTEGPKAAKTYKAPPVETTLSLPISESWLNPNDLRLRPIDSDYPVPIVKPMPIFEPVPTGPNNGEMHSPGERRNGEESNMAAGLGRKEKRWGTEQTSQNEPPPQDGQSLQPELPAQDRQPSEVGSVGSSVQDGLNLPGGLQLNAAWAVKHSPATGIYRREPAPEPTQWKYYVPEADHQQSVPEYVKPVHEFGAVQPVGNGEVEIQQPAPDFYRRQLLSETNEGEVSSATDAVDDVSTLESDQLMALSAAAQKADLSDSIVIHRPAPGLYRRQLWVKQPQYVVMDANPNYGLSADSQDESGQSESNEPTEVSIADLLIHEPALELWHRDNHGQPQHVDNVNIPSTKDFERSQDRGGEPLQPVVVNADAMTHQPVGDIHRRDTDINLPSYKPFDEPLGDRLIHMGHGPVVSPKSDGNLPVTTDFGEGPIMAKRAPKHNKEENAKDEKTERQGKKADQNSVVDFNYWPYIGSSAMTHAGEPLVFGVGKRAPVEDPRKEERTAPPPEFFESYAWPASLAEEDATRTWTPIRPSHAWVRRDEEMAMITSNRDPCLDPKSRARMLRIGLYQLDCLSDQKGDTEEIVEKRQQGDADIRERSETHSDSYSHAEHDLSWPSLNTHLDDWSSYETPPIAEDAPNLKPILSRQSEENTSFADGLPKDASGTWRDALGRSILDRLHDKYVDPAIAMETASDVHKRRSHGADTESSTQNGEEKETKDKNAKDYTKEVQKNSDDDDIKGGVSRKIKHPGLDPALSMVPVSRIWRKRQGTR
ncbi:hypothetical protein EJ02DRAFT_471344 [Clathrospora elynae]|uniref:Uncharacterized protein n=1 Tax=Clathrospora elynae TaxID=706981 RepID=A0A6A5S6M0_9PLEO|nr:hypothetical protein EJ02DRAFT_471344 [Clathrospora elynae]